MVLNFLSLEKNKKFFYFEEKIYNLWVFDSFKFMKEV